MRPLNRTIPLALFAAALGLGCAPDDDPPVEPPAPDAAPACPPGAIDCPCAADACHDGSVCDAVSGYCRAPLPCACAPHQQCEVAEGHDPACLEECAAGYDWDALGERCVADVCHPDAPGSIAADCAADHRSCVFPGHCGGCLPGFAPGPDGCAPVAGCAELDCEADNRGCVDDDGPPRCDGCLAGWVDFGGVCQPDTCDLVVPGSTAESCAAQDRLCVDDPGGATCGDCVAGRREVDDGDGVRCEPLATCAGLDCAADGRACTPADAIARMDAACGGCLPGLAPDADGQCVPAGLACDDPVDGDVGAPTIADACAALGRPCLAGLCEPTCLDGWREAPALGACERMPSCDDCDGIHRQCMVEVDGIHCGDCAEGYTLDPETGACAPDCPEADQIRHPVTGVCVTACDPAVGCLGGDVCHLVGDGDDDDGDDDDCDDGDGDGDDDEDDGVYVCGPDCGGGLFNGVDCVACPACDRQGEVRPHPSPTLDGRCVCETEVGYYYSLAGEIGPRACDVDGDRWLVRAARTAIEHPDPVIRCLARCTPTVVDTVRLVNEAGQAHVVTLDAPVTLYESEGNDDPARLRQRFEQAGVPPDLIEGAWGAEMLNPLVRLCHTAGADYDDDGTADANAPSGVVGIGASPTMQALGRFVHFGELHSMQIATMNVGAGPQLGEVGPPVGGASTVLVITEKKPDAIGFAVEFPEMADPEGWKHCTVRPDSRYDPQTPRPGFDFADLPISDGPDGFAGMTHHSLFRCLVVRNAAAVDALHEVEALRAGDDYALTRHDGAGGFEAVTGRPEAGEALWGVARYQHAGPGLKLAHDYRFGCVDECAEYRSAYRAHISKYENDLVSLANPGLLASLAPSLGERCYTLPGDLGADIACRDLPDRFGQVKCEGVPCNFDDEGNPIDDDGDGVFDEFGALPTSLEGVETVQGAGDTGHLTNPCIRGGQLGRCGVGQFTCGGPGGTPECGEVDDPSLVEIPCGDENHPDCMKIAEIPCNYVDEDCDGSLDEEPLLVPDTIVTEDGKVHSLRIQDDAYVVTAEGAALPELGESCYVGDGVCTNSRGTLRCGEYADDPPPVRCLVCDDDGACEEPAPLVPEVGDSTETCDGRDQDCDGTSDEGLDDPADLCSGGLPCDVQQDENNPIYGVCATGLTTCSGTCVQFIQPGDLEETCNGHDDDCDGRVDEREGEEGEACVWSEVTGVPIAVLHASKGEDGEPDFNGMDGDADFDGKGPNVTIEINLYVGDNNSIRYTVKVVMEETPPPGVDGDGTFGAKIVEGHVSFNGVPAIVHGGGLNIAGLDPQSTVEGLDYVLFSYLDTGHIQDKVYGHSEEHFDHLDPMVAADDSPQFAPYDERDLEKTVQAVICNGDNVGNDLPGLANIVSAPGDDELLHDGAWCWVELNVRATPATIVTPDLANCGDGDPNPGEECDDGNRCAGDGCDPLCRSEPQP